MLIYIACLLVIVQVTVSQIATYTCPRGGILFSITPGMDRVGMISVQGYSNVQGCSLLTSDRHYQLFVPLINPSKPPCGIKMLPNGNYGATFITQALANLYTTIDRKYEVTCQLGQELSSESLPVQVTGSVLHGTVMQQTAEVVLEIRDISGSHKQTSLTLGQLAMLYMYLPDTSVLKGMDIDTCVAYDTAQNKNGESIILFQNGCGTDTIFPSDQGFTQAQGKPTSHMVSPAFEMFRFITTNTVVVECTFTRFCTVDNDPDCAMSCPYKFNTTRRMRRSVAQEKPSEPLVALESRVRQRSTGQEKQSLALESIIQPRPIMKPNTTTKTIVNVFNEDDLMVDAPNATDYMLDAFTNTYEDDLCISKATFVISQSIVAAVALLFLVVSLVSCYKIIRLKETDEKLTPPPTDPSHLHYTLY